MMKKYFLLTLALGLFSACGEDDDTSSAPGATLPTAIAGTQSTLACTFANTGAPHQVGDEALFSFGSDGSLSIDFDPAANNGAEVNVSSATQVNTEFVWEDANSGYKYALSLDASDSINEVNVFDAAETFLNQWEPKPDVAAELALIIALQGTYTVQSVNGGTHSRGSFIINADGSIDFDSGLSFSPSDYALISDRLGVLDAIFIDLQPWPDEPYPRLELFVDPNDQSVLKQCIYRPNYPGSGAIELNF